MFFCADPVTAERELLRPWANDARRWYRFAAGYALGAPVALGADPSAARSLARYWSTSENVRFRHASVFAYGGPLGAWDHTSSAAVQLARLGGETPSLQADADQAIGRLTVAGRSAMRSRHVVLRTMEALGDDRRTARRAFGLLPIVYDSLTRPTTASEESFASLWSDAEEATRSILVELMVEALLAPAGYDAARRSFQILLVAAADGRIDETIVVDRLQAVRPAEPSGHGGHASGSALSAPPPPDAIPAASTTAEHAPAPGDDGSDPTDDDQDWSDR